MKEIELIDLFCAFLKEKGYEFKRELRKGSYHSEGYVDIVIKVGDTPLEFSAIEAKTNAFAKVISQAASNKVSFNYSFILIPKEPSDKVYERCKRLGIGIIYYENTIFHLGLKNTLNNFHFYSVYQKRIIRNWFQNRIGRLLTKRELPENYNVENLPNPTYDWVKNTNNCPFCKKKFNVVQLSQEESWCIKCGRKWNPLLPVVITKKEKHSKYPSKEFPNLTQKTLF